MTRCKRALGQQVEGDSEPYKALWSQKDPVMVMGAACCCDRGWGGQRRDRRGLENDPGRQPADRQPPHDRRRRDGGHGRLRARDHQDGRGADKTLRCTHGYRVEDGVWKVFLRHADEYDPEGLRAGPRAAGREAARREDRPVEDRPEDRPRRSARGPPGGARRGGPLGGGPPAAARRATESKAP